VSGRSGSDDDHVMDGRIVLSAWCARRRGHQVHHGLPPRTAAAAFGSNATVPVHIPGIGVRCRSVGYGWCPLTDTSVISDWNPPPSALAALPSLVNHSSRVSVSGGSLRPILTG